MISDTTYYVVYHVAHAALAFMQRDSYLYWPFIVSTLAIVLTAPFWEKGGRHHFFDRATWWNPSTRADYRLYFVNALLFPATVAYVSFTDIQFTAALHAFFGTAGSTQTIGASAATQALLVKLLYTLCIFIAFDFGRYVAHWLLHEIPALWEFHKVHHSAQVLTPLTSYRAHPIDLMVMGSVPAVITGAVTWLFNLAGGNVSVYAFLGVHVLIWGFNLIDNLRHSDVWLSFGPRVGRWLISPAHHQLHHSIEPRHWGCNRGNTLAIWDRLFGTLYVPGFEREQFRMGLGDGTEARWNSVWYTLTHPFVAVAQSLMGRPRADGESAPAKATDERRAAGSG